MKFIHNKETWIDTRQHRHVNEIIIRIRTSGTHERSFRIPTNQTMILFLHGRKTQLCFSLGKIECDHPLCCIELNNRGKIEVKKSWAEITSFGPKLFNLNKVWNSIELLETFALRNSSSTQHKTCSYVS